MIPASPFACRFDTSFQATPEEHKQIRHIISTAVDEYKRIDALIHDLTLQRDALQQHIEKHHKLIPPIHSMPVEIVQKIFNHCPPSDHNAIMSIHEAPLLLGHVCSAWRQISHSTPQLWSSIHINYPKTSSVRFGEKFCGAVDAWLHRSSNLPLSISISLNEEDRDPGLMNDMINVLIRFSPRWKNLALQLRGYRFRSSITGFKTPLLTAVTIKMTGNPGENAAKLLYFLRTSSLRTVSLTNMAALPPIQWKNITHLHLSAGTPIQYSSLFSAERVNEILQTTPNLVSCKLEVAINHRFEPVVITLPYLNILHLVFHPLRQNASPFITTFLSTLNTPNLSDLRFRALCRTTMIVPFKPLLSLNLINLVYTISNVPAYEIADALALIPSLRRLHLATLATKNDLNNPPPGSSLSCELLVLLQGDAKSPLLPFLEHLDITADDTTDITTDSLLQLILSRTDRAPAGTAHLQRARFSFAIPRPSGMDIILALSSAIEDGLQVQISYQEAKKRGTGVLSPRNEIELAAQPREWERGFWDSEV